MDKRKIAVIAVLAMLTAFVSGCSEQVPFLNGEEGTAASVISTNIRLPISRIRTLNPAISRDEDSYHINRLIYDGLFKLDENLRAEPVLAHGFTMREDGVSMIVSLNQEAKWHDGRSFTAQDVKYSIEAYMSNDSYYYTYVKNISSVAVQDSSSVIIYYSDPTDISVCDLTFPILPSHQYASVAELRRAEEAFFPIGTGQYAVTSVDLGDEIVMEGNLEYHGSRTTNTVTFKVMPDRLESVSLFGINDLSVTYTKDLNREAELSTNNINITSFVSNEMELMGFNCSSGPLSDKRVRKALALMIDQKEIIEMAYNNSGVASDSLYYPGYMGTDLADKPEKINVDEAVRLLAEAGYMDRMGNGFVQNEAGEEITVRILVNSENSNRSAAAGIIKKELDKLPLHAVIIYKDWGAYSADIASGNYDIYIGGYSIQDSFDLRFLLHSGYSNPAGYSHIRLNGLLDTMRTGLTMEQSRITFEEIKTIINDEMPYLCLLYKTYGIVTSEDLKGDVKPTFFGFYSGVESWRIEY